MYTHPFRQACKPGSLNRHPMRPHRFRYRSLTLGITTTLLLFALTLGGECLGALKISSSAQAAPEQISPAEASAPAASKVYLPLIMRSANGSQIYWGAYVESKPPSTAELRADGHFGVFEALVKKKLAIIHWGQPWKMNGEYQPFPAEYLSNTRNHGSLPLLDWGSWELNGGATQPAYRLSTITSGQYDSYIRQWAKDAKVWGHPFFLRFDWEMNGDWQFPWSEQINGNQPGDYINAWRHVHHIFTQEGAENVTWVWCPNISGTTTRPMAQLYPGNAYVDWTCLDGYNKYSTAWLSFNTVFTGSGIDWLYNSYEEILKVAPSKPLMLGEFASRENGDGGAKKAEWIIDALTVQIPKNFPKIKAVVWFNWQASFPIESSTAASNAFAKGISLNYYAKNNFANYNTSPIQPIP
jgi:hypothetical protein